METDHAIAPARFEERIRPSESELRAFDFNSFEDGRLFSPSEDMEIFVELVVPKIIADICQIGPDGEPELIENLRLHFINEDLAAGEFSNLQEIEQDEPFAQELHEEVAPEAPSVRSVLAHSMPKVTARHHASVSNHSFMLPTRLSPSQGSIIFRNVRSPSKSDEIPLKGPKEKKDACEKCLQSKPSCGCHAKSTQIDRDE